MVFFTVYEVQVEDLIYFARGGRTNSRSGKLANDLIVGDEIEAAISGEELVLRRPDGKEIKAKIVRRQRADAR